MQTKILLWFLVFLISGISLLSCGQLTKSPTLPGVWKAENVKVEVRTKPGGKWHFTPGVCNFELKISDGFLVDGNIGTTGFKSGNLKTNSLLPVKMTGISYIVKCGSIGKIFDYDPVDHKEVELWLGPERQDTMHCELRFTEHGAAFPMAGFDLLKEK